MVGGQSALLRRICTANKGAHVGTPEAKYRLFGVTNSNQRPIILIGWKKSVEERPLKLVCVLCFVHNGQLEARANVFNESDARWIRYHIMRALKQIIETWMIQSCLLNASLAVGNHLPIGIQKLLIFVRYRLSFNEWVLLIHPGLCERIVQQLCYYLSHTIWVYSSDVQPKHCLRHNHIINHLRNDAFGDVVLANIA